MIENIFYYTELKFLIPLLFFGIVLGMLDVWFFPLKDDHPFSKNNFFNDRLIGGLSTVLCIVLLALVGLIVLRFSWNIFDFFVEIALLY